MAADVDEAEGGEDRAGRGSVKIASANGKVMVDKATVTKADIAASNGVIHVIDTVLMPQ